MGCFCLTHVLFLSVHGTILVDFVMIRVVNYRVCDDTDSNYSIWAVSILPGVAHLSILDFS